MKIGKPVSEVPETVRRGGAFSPVLVAILATPEGQWLPVECESIEEARILRSYASPSQAWGRRGIEGRMRGTKVYFRRNGK